MRIRTLLNQCQQYKSFCFVKEYTEQIKGKPALIVEIRARKNGKPICSGCLKPRIQYDRMPNDRDDQFIPIWGYPVYFRYQRRRVSCKACGVKVEQVPWSEGKQKLTTDYQVFLAQWARQLSWKGVADAFHTSWESLPHEVLWV